MRILYIAGGREISCSTNPHLPAKMQSALWCRKQTSSQTLCSLTVQHKFPQNFHKIQQIFVSSRNKFVFWELIAFVVSWKTPIKLMATRQGIRLTTFHILHWLEVSCTNFWIPMNVHLKKSIPHLNLIASSNCFTFTSSGNWNQSKSASIIATGPFYTLPHTLFSFELFVAATNVII